MIGHGCDGLVHDRLGDYRLSEDEVQSVAHDAFNYVANQQQQIKDDDGAFNIILVVVGPDFLTVQQEGEPMDVAVDRAVKPESVFPLRLCYVATLVGSRILELYFIYDIRLGKFGFRALHLRRCTGNEKSVHTLRLGKFGFRALHLRRRTGNEKSVNTSAVNIACPSPRLIDAKHIEQVF
ncbi:hypothetical protein PHJA_001773700 [Phtheirospermum japonicum]|uniref:Uncharacterized protein n=1 Tax=Phtheirospermum japonicum TaxID=374723 RepID=A0A830CAS9_9LAMI|nr:hypothetical protein PHJA_001773700 [Phtheirospermum japonicum]